MTKRGHGLTERGINRKKVKVNSLVAKIKKNKRIQKGIFNLNESNRAAPLPKKARREERKQEKKAQKKMQVQQLKAEKQTAMDTE